MRRVLLMIKGLGRGGAEQLLVSSIRHSDGSRVTHEVAYLLPWKDALVAELRERDVPVWCLDGARGAGWTGRLRRLVGERGIDLVHVHSPYPAVGARLALPRSIPLVYTEHNVWERYHRATYWGNMLTYGRNDHVFSVSKHVASTIRYPAALRFRRMPPVETLYHGPDPDVLGAPISADGVREEFGIPDGVPIVGTIANLKPHKGHEHLLRAAVTVRERIPEVRFVLVGQGPRETELRHLAAELGIEDAVVFAGFRTDALRIAAAFDVFVLASLYEGLSIALVEAMALGKPPVITPVGGLGEVVTDGEHGLVVPVADPRALADAVLSLLQDEPLRKRLGNAARDRVAAFDMLKAVRRMESVYEELAV
jgi:glycosyltransferase involved in cell wall biosynthesis